MTAHRAIRTTVPLALAAAVLLVGSAVSAGQEPPPPECTAADGQSQVVRIRWSGPEGTVLSGAAVEVSYPTSSLVIPGKGTALPSDTRVEGPAGTMLALSDEDGTLRVLVAGPKKIEGSLLARVRFRRCEGAAAPAKDSLTCRVLSASDNTSNALENVACTATLE